MSEIAKPKNVAEILSEWLKEHGYDGLCLYYEEYDGCYCEAPDLALCDNPMKCMPGYKHEYRADKCDALDCNGDRKEGCYCLSTERWEKEEAKNEKGD